jgi:hypothetical protein
MTNLVTKEVQEVTRYDSGDVLSSRDKRVGIPIEPQSLGAAFPNDISGRILSELSKTAELLNGVEGSGEDESRPGLLKTGQKLVESLNKIAAKKLSVLRRPRAPPVSTARGSFRLSVRSCQRSVGKPALDGWKHQKGSLTRRAALGAVRG